VAQAVIKVNGVIGSNTDLPINTLVQLDNVNNGGEVSYLWSILDQPAGAADALSSTTVQNPTFTPKKEGTYLIRLDVNHGLGSESVQQVVVAVRQMKSRLRDPAAQETIEADPSVGWKGDANANLQALDALIADSGVQVMIASYAGNRGDVVMVNTRTQIKVGMPGAEYLPSIAKASSATMAGQAGQLGIVEGKVGGANAFNNGDLVRVRVYGLFQGVSMIDTPVGTAVYLNDTAGTLSSSPGTIRRKIATVIASGGGVVQLLFNGGDFDPFMGLSRYLVGPAGSGAPYQTIQAAASAAGNDGGGVVIVLPKPGPLLDPSTYYTENVTLPENVSLKGEGAAVQVIINGTLTMASVAAYVAVKDVVVVDSIFFGAVALSSSTYECYNVFANALAATSGNDAFNVLNGGELHLYNCQNSGSVNGHGIYCAASTNVIVGQGSKIEGGSAVIGAPPSGIRMDGGGSVRVTGNSRVAGRIEITTAACNVELWGCLISLAALENCAVYGFAGSGISFKDVEITGLSGGTPIVLNGGAINSFDGVSCNTAVVLGTGVTSNTSAFSPATVRSSGSASGAGILLTFLYERMFLSNGGLAFNATLPPSATILQGFECTFVNDQGGQIMTLTANGADTIDGAASKAYDCSTGTPNIRAVTLRLEGTTWRQIATCIKV